MRYLKHIYYNRFTCIYIILGIIVACFSLIVQSSMLTMKDVIIYSIYILLSILYIVDFYLYKTKGRCSSGVIILSIFLLFSLLAIFSRIID